MALIPVTVPWDDVEVAMQTGELDGVAGADLLRHMKWVGLISANMH